MFHRKGPLCIIGLINLVKEVLSVETFEDFLATMGEPDHKDKMETILNWVQGTYPELKTRIAWSQPMFVDHGTFIIGFSHSKNQISMSPEGKAIREHLPYIEEAGLSYTDNIIRIKWADPIPYDLIKMLIDYNIEDKKDYTKFWR